MAGVIVISMLISAVGQETQLDIAANSYNFPAQPNCYIYFSIEAL